MRGAVRAGETESAAGVAPWESTPIYRCSLPGSAPLNAAILEGFQSLVPEDFERRTHLIRGRYENLYLDPARIPALGTVLDYGLECAARILGRPVGGLRRGFWLNAMGPGESTSEHIHDENDELLSAVYYVVAAERSGELILYDGPLTIRVEPVAGTFLFFPPDLPHAVETNLSPRLRLSLGINFGPRARV